MKFATREDNQSRGKTVGHVVEVEDKRIQKAGLCYCLRGQPPEMFSDEWARITGKRNKCSIRRVGVIAMIFV